MAFSGKAVADESVIHADVSDFVSSNSYTKTKVLDRLGMALAPATDVTHSWPQTDLRTYTGQLNEALDNSETAVDVDDGTLYAANDRIRVDDEWMEVTSISTNTLTLVRGYAASDAVTHLDNAKIWIDRPRLEGADAGTVTSTARTKVDNFTHIFSDPIEVSRSLRNVNTAGVADEFQHQTEQRLAELLQQLERAVLYSVKATTPRGTATIELVPSATSLGASFEAAGLDITAVHSGNGPLNYEMVDGRLDVGVPLGSTTVVVEYDFSVQGQFNGLMSTG